MKKLTKISLVILSCALVLGAMFMVSAGAAEAEPEGPEIISQNINYQGNFALMYAVRASTVTSGSVTLKVYDKYPEAGVEPIWTNTNSTPEFVGGNLNETVYKFTTAGVSAANMTKNFYIVAVDGDKESEVKRYSVAEYLYKRLSTVPVVGDDGKANPSAAQKDLYNAVIDFGDKAQIVFAESNGTEVPTLISKYRYVTVTDGTVDGFKTGAYPVGTLLNLKADDANAPGVSWNSMTYNNEGAAIGEKLIMKESVTVPETEGVVKIAIDAVTLRAGTQTFDEFETTDAFEFSRTIQTYNTPTVSYVKEDGRGTVVKIVTDASGDGVKLRNDMTYDESKGHNAWEVSFDIKLELNGSSSETLKYMLVTPERLEEKADGTGTTLKPYFTQNWATKHSSAGENMYVWGGSNSIKRVLADFKEGDWVSLRIVFYKNDSSCYLYLNGSETPIEFTDASWSGDMTEFNHIALRANGYSKTSNFYIDNYFNGYITENSPNPKAAE